MPENPVARIRHNLVGLRMPRALEALDAVIQQIERGQIGAIEAIDTLLAEEITMRQRRRIRAALQMARLTTIKTLTGFDFSFQPSLDRNRITALASLDFIDKHEVVHFIGQSGTGKSHLAIALGVEAIRAGRSVYFCALADIIDSLARADREGRLRERIRYGRELLLDPGGGAADPPEVHLAGRGPDGVLQLHRGLVQPSAPAFGTGLSIPHGIRSSTGGGPDSNVARKPEKRPLKRGKLKPHKSGNVCYET
jgi:hypothetical protein